MDQLSDHKDKGQVKGYVVFVGLEPWTTELITKTWGRSLSVVGAATNIILS